jgi:hypothetical protein
MTPEMEIGAQGGDLWVIFQATRNMQQSGE